MSNLIIRFKNVTQYKNRLGKSFEIARSSTDYYDPDITFTFPLSDNDSIPVIESSTSGYYNTGTLTFSNKWSGWLIVLVSGPNEGYGYHLVKPNTTISLVGNSSKLSVNCKIIAGDIVKTDEKFFIFYHPHTRRKPTNETWNEHLKNEILYLEQNDGYFLHQKYLGDAPTEYHKLIATMIRMEREFYSDNQIGEIIRNWKQNSLKR
jgi:hypothetical protein